MEASVEKTTMNSIEKYSFLDNIGEPVPKSNLIGKRICDIIFGTIFGIISLPIIFVFAILIKITTKGPVFFKQQLKNILVYNFGYLKYVVISKVIPINFYLTRVICLLAFGQNRK